MKIPGSPPPSPPPDCPTCHENDAVIWHVREAGWFCHHTHDHAARPRAGYLAGVVPDAVLLVDLDSGVSITNDAEAVVKRILSLHGKDFPDQPPRILYQDTQGDWSELKHDGQKFTGFAELSDEEKKTRDLT